MLYCISPANKYSDSDSDSVMFTTHVSRVHYVKERLCFASLFENHGCKGRPTNKVNCIVKSMENIYESQWRDELSRTISKNKTGGNKLRTYYTFKENSKYEAYLDLQGTFSLRSNITKIRINAHKLEIEAGRYSTSAKNNNSEARDCARIVI